MELLLHPASTRTLIHDDGVSSSPASGRRRRRRRERDGRETLTRWQPLQKVRCLLFRVTLTWLFPPPRFYSLRYKRHRCSSNSAAKGPRPAQITDFMAAVNMRASHTGVSDLCTCRPCVSCLHWHLSPCPLKTTGPQLIRLMPFKFISNPVVFSLQSQDADMKFIY